MPSSIRALYVLHDFCRVLSYHRSDEDGRVSVSLFRIFLFPALTDGSFSLPSQCHIVPQGWYVAIRYTCKLCQV